VTVSGEMAGGAEWKKPPEQKEGIQELSFAMPIFVPEYEEYRRRRYESAKKLVEANPQSFLGKLWTAAGQQKVADDHTRWLSESAEIQEWRVDQQREELQKALSDEAAKRRQMYQIMLLRPPQ
jgi:hypothetical protein